MFTAGAQLNIVKSANPRVAPTGFVLLTRFALMPAVALAFVWFTAGRGWYTADPLVWSVGGLVSCERVAMPAGSVGIVAQAYG